MEGCFLEINILVGGAAGQGMDTVMNLLGKTLVREGFNLIYNKDYMSRVRGGHNFSKLRISDTTPLSPVENTDILIALNEETYNLHMDSLHPQGRIVYDPSLFGLPDNEKRGVPVKLKELAKEAGNSVMANTVAVGAILVLLGLKTKVIEQILYESFSDKDGKGIKKENGGVAYQNIAALKAGYEEAAEFCSACFELPKEKTSKDKLFVDGNQVLGMSALASGCRFMSAYPMTPSTGIMTYLSAKSIHHDVVVEQAEDEIAAINMVLGASYGGVRALTATSGGGFSLMVEGLSLAGITETPIVIILAMRPGPATGLPTRTEQGDLEFVISAGHGEFPRAVLSASSHEDAFYRLNKAFELADSFQIPVIFLSDQNFADTHRSLDPFDFAKLSYNRCLTEEAEVQRPYQRYRFTESGLSPRILPGEIPGEVVLVDSDEHDENGNIIEDSKTRRFMVDKRINKLDGLAKEMDEPEFYGAPNADILLIGWGSTYGVIKEAVDGLLASGTKACRLHFSDIYPLPQKVLKEILPQIKSTFSVENNATGQMASFIQREAGITIDHLVVKYDGRPFFPEDIIREVNRYES